MAQNRGRWWPLAQLQDHIRGLTIQGLSKTESVRLVNERLEVMEPLLPQGVVVATEITALKRDRTVLVGDRGELASQIAQAHETISARRLQMIQVEEEFRSGGSTNCPAAHDTAPR